MVPKRKRNVKIEPGETYNVVNMDDLDMNCLEEFALPHIDTGMEAEEEKEIHLKKIIDSGSGNIPIPVIKKIKNPAKDIYKKIQMDRNYVNWKKDVQNSYFMENKDKALCQQLGISEDEYLGAVDELEDDAHVKIENEDKIVETRASSVVFSRNPPFNFLPQASKILTNNEEHNTFQDSIIPENPLHTSETITRTPSYVASDLETFIMPCLEENQTNGLSPIVKEEIKELARYKRLIRDEDKAHPSYVCFRRRVLKPSRKNRRSEAQTMEKVVRLDNELSLLYKLSKLRKDVCEMNDKIYDVNFEIYKLTSNIILKHEKYGQRKLRRLIRNHQIGQNKSGGLEQGDIFKNILFDRDRIRMINKRLRLAKENIDEEEIEKEAIGYTNYLKSIYDNVSPK